MIPLVFSSIGEYTTLMEKVEFKVTFANFLERPTPLKGTDGLRELDCHVWKNDVWRIKSWNFKSNYNKCWKKLRKIMSKEDIWMGDYKRIKN